ncbi:MAG: exopolyphosphatase [Campylobacterota bacterium]|nr:exopolyphosphatase [Campylobacterota bacterium]
MSHTITSIDLGSNSFRVLHYDCSAHRILNQFETVVGTADGLAQSGEISQAALNRIIQAIQQAQNLFSFDPTSAIAVTTQAMRKASNAQEILQQIVDKTGISFRIIDGQEEAKLTLLAIQYALKRENINDEHFILVDIGGGSTEIILSSPRHLYSQSFEMGIITLTQSDNKEQSFKNFCNEVEAFIQHSNVDVSAYNFISTAGTPTTIAALKCGLNYETYDSKIINGTCVTLEDCTFYKNLLLNSSAQEAQVLVGSGRHEYLESGITIFETLFTLFEQTQSIVFDDGLREGVAINWCLNRN